MSRENSEGKASFSPVQRKACLVMALCIVAVVVTFIVSWVLPPKLGWVHKEVAGYDPNAYPVNSSLGAVLTQTGDAGDGYLSETLFVGDQYTQSIQNAGQISMEQFAGVSGLSVGDVVRNACVYFSEDTSSYTVPQALAKIKPRRIVVTLGSNDLSGNLDVNQFIQNYRQTLQAMKTAYSYGDIIVNSIPPVLKSEEDSASKQLRADAFNQALAELCESEGYKFLHSAQGLKGDDGYAESAYLTSNGYTGAGINTLLNYYRTHAYQTEDRRPDTSDIPQRATQPAVSATEAPPSPTPVTHTVSYQVEKEGQGTLTGNGQSNVSNLEWEVEDRATVSVTAVASEGYTFYKWSDGQTAATRYDIATQDISVIAMFNDARVEISLDHGNTVLNPGESVTIKSLVKLGGKEYDNSQVQWAVNGDLESNGGEFTFTAKEAGTYTIKAGIEINGTYQSAQASITVNAPTTILTIAGPSSIPAGSSTTLSATGQNLSGDIAWSCEQQPGWSAFGMQVQFSAQVAGSYHIVAYNNGDSAEFVLVVTDVAKPEPTATVSPDTVPTEGPIESITPTP